ncbi:MAG: hypothetical protein IIX54_04970 [Clostridia bacterium]|nr:hypothetical protein [Clostridia bacterium]
MKIIFLDVDGVLNSEKYKTESSANCDNGYIDLSRVKLVADIVNATNAKIVLISSLRVDWDKSLELCGNDGKYINKCFAENGLSIMDKTPYISFFTARKKEITFWLSSHQNEVESFVIIDDMLDGWEELNSRVVNTNPNGYGLEEEHVKKAIELLK